jgi:hypothetical protein
MKTLLSLALIAFSSLAFAQAGPGMGGMAGNSGPQAKDCAQARDPLRCEARSKAREACAGKRGAQRRQCVEEQMPPPDCAKAKNTSRCEQRQVAQEACKGKPGKEHRQCMKQQMPKAPPPPSAPAAK